MRSSSRWFSRSTRDATVDIGHSRVRPGAIDTALFIARAGDPTIKALVDFHSPFPEARRIRAKFRGPEAEMIRRLFRGPTRR